MRKVSYELVMLITFITILLLFIIKSMSIKKHVYNIPTDIETLEYNYIEPEDYAKNKNLSEGQREYYEYLYKKSK